MQLPKLSPSRVQSQPKELSRGGRTGSTGEGESQLNKMPFLLTSFTSNFCSPVNQLGLPGLERACGGVEGPERLTTHRGAEGSGVVARGRQVISVNCDVFLIYLFPVDPPVSSWTCSPPSRWFEGRAVAQERRGSLTATSSVPLCLL